MLCFRKFPVAKNSMDNKGVSRLSVEKFLSHYAENCRKENSFVLCFRKLPVAKKIMDEGGGYPGFPSENFYLTMPNSFLGEPFCVVF